MTDIALQSRSGPEISELWQDKHPEAKFLFTSTLAQEARQHPRLASSNLLWKPFTAQSLCEQVADILAGRG